MTSYNWIFLAIGGLRSLYEDCVLSRNEECIYEEGNRFYLRMFDLFTLIYHILLMRMAQNDKIFITMLKLGKNVRKGSMLP